MRCPDTELLSIPIFGGLHQQTVNDIIEKSSVFTCEPGVYMLCEGDTGDAFYILVGGQAKVVRGDPEQHLFDLGRGDCFGEMALIDHQPRSASVRAISSCVVMEITQDTLFDLYQTNPKQYTLLHMNMAREVSRRLRYADNHIQA
ncbi:MAG: cyclic nucleotide-binding domain-containing protein [Gammaproteobacteria bacterium]|nr:cyclic nucleotide-binding domain-containing protein [Gammaproteobacteria bacterium]